MTSQARSAGMSHQPPSNARRNRTGRATSAAMIRCAPGREQVSTEQPGEAEDHEPDDHDRPDHEAGPDERDAEAQEREQPGDRPDPLVHPRLL